MERISEKDRQRLRALARKQLEYANSPRNAEIMKMWEAQAQGRRETPTVRLLFSNFNHEVVTPRLECENEAARGLEFKLVQTLVGRELFDDDTPIQSTFDMHHHTWFYPFGIQPKITRASGKNAQGYHLDPVIEDLEAELDKLRGGSFGVDREGTRKEQEFVQDVLGDILPVRLVQSSLPGQFTYPLVLLMGMEAYYIAMYDAPEALHEVMEMVTRLYEEYYAFLEREKLLLPTSDFFPLMMESFCFNSELPSDHVVSTKQCWGFMESQETTAVAPETYGEFVYPYQDRLAKHFGMLSYGCCERVDAIWENYLSKWKNLRKLSVSPFNNEPQVGEYLRGSNVVYYSKPRAEFVSNPGSIDEDALRKNFRMVCESASGCLFEVAQREVGTIYGDFERGRRYVQILRECIADYWKP